MANISLLQGIELVRGGIHSYITKRPIVVSYEVTLSCNCNCRHLEKGGLRSLLLEAVAAAYKKAERL